MTSAQETDVPGDYRLLLPEGWFRVDLDPDRRDRSINALVERQFHGIDNAPHLKDEFREDLRRRAAKAHRSGGIELYLSLQEVGPFTIPASLLVTLAPLQRPEPLPLEALVRALAEDGAGTVGIENLPAGPAVRVRKLVPQGSGQEGPASAPHNSVTVEYHLPVPGTTAFLLLTFSTPLEPIADAMAELFDAIAGSLTWQE
ncbi:MULTISPECIES: hypothetical protein [unclassified Streptomyces]|uniref:hypothetical protein n=1 Tax=unclassified Streptomyces TaxID=2593676 RepID=UPI001661ADD7|nr:MULTISPECIES: hypothetical protein [unclassified Streptomyces]MBD0842733.1 hypothetical protein [Streptomyces sp. TRM68416]